MMPYKWYMLPSSDFSVSIFVFSVSSGVFCFATFGEQAANPKIIEPSKILGFTNIAPPFVLSAKKENIRNRNWMMLSFICCDTVC